MPAARARPLAESPASAVTPSAPTNLPSLTISSRGALPGCAPRASAISKAMRSSTSLSHSCDADPSPRSVERRPLEPLARAPGYEEVGTASAAPPPPP